MTRKTNLIHENGMLNQTGIDQTRRAGQAAALRQMLTGLAALLRGWLGREYAGKRARETVAAGR